MRKIIIYLIAIAVLLLAGIFFFRFKERISAVPLPPAQTYQSAMNSEAGSATTTGADPILAGEINLKIPFTSQAPHQNWDLPYQQFCEEASALMAASYINSQPIANPNDADAKLLAIKDFEMKKFGFYEDTNAEETAEILREHFSLAKVDVVPDPTAQKIKTALSEGKAVIVPLAGRQLGNPYYQQPGPLYHMLVIKGYNKNGDFITNDPGTRRGADFIYKANTLMDAIHDWNGGDVNAGRKVILVIG